ncbi:MAG: tRNA adenosine(34) deaminase TadA [bacterium]
MDQPRQFMEAALVEAQKALSNNEVPVGAVIVYEGQIIGKGYNQVEQLNDPTAHAEMIAISAAANYLQSWRLENCSLYVTLEPCSMCAGAIVLSRIKWLYYGADDPKAGSCGSLRNIVRDQRLNHQVILKSGIMAPEAQDLLKEFFRKVRKRKK